MNVFIIFFITICGTARMSGKNWEVIVIEVIESKKININPFPRDYIKIFNVTKINT